MAKRIHITEKQLFPLFEHLSGGERYHHNIFIDDETDKILTNIICEELGVSRDVEYTAMNFVDALQSLIYGRKGDDHNKTFNCETYSGSEPFACFGMKIFLDYNIVNFKDKYGYNAYAEKKYHGYTQYSPNNTHFNFELVSLNKKLDKESVKTIQHEIHHYYEIRRAGKDNLIRDKQQPLYDRVSERLGELSNKKGKMTKEEENEYDVYYALYMCFESEQRAFMNNLDKDMENCGGLWKTQLSHADVYRSLTKMKTILKDVDKNRDIIENGIGITVEEYRNLLLQSIKSLNKKIGRIIVRNQNKEMNEGIRTYQSFNVLK